MALEEEVDEASQPEWDRDPSVELDAMIPQQKLSLNEIHRQLQKWTSRH